MKYVYLLLIGITLLAVVGIIIAFDLFGIGRRKRAKKAEQEALDNASLDDGSSAADGADDLEEPDEDPALDAIFGKKSLQDSINYYQGKRGLFIKEQFNSIQNILGETGRTKEYAKTVLTCILFLSIGVLVGVLLKSPFVAIVLGVGLFFVPIWRLRVYQSKYRKYLSQQCESCCSLITTSYIRCGDIIQAIEENIEFLAPLLRSRFVRFINETKVNPSLKNCIRDLRESINDGIFREWCTMLMKTTDNSEMKEALIPIVEKFSDVRIVQEEVDQEIKAQLIEYAVMLAMIPGSYLLVLFINKEWFASYFTTVGTIFVALSLFVLFYSISRLIAITAPVEYKR